MLAKKRKKCVLSRVLWKATVINFFVEEGILNSTLAYVITFQLLTNRGNKRENTVNYGLC